MEFTGKVIWVGEPRSGVSKTGKEWTSVSFVVEDTDGKFAQAAMFDLFNHEVDFVVGDVVRVMFDFRAREWNGKWFNSLSAFKVEKVTSLFVASGPSVAGGTGMNSGMTGNPGGTGMTGNYSGNAAGNPIGGNSNSDGDDLPF